MFTTLPRYFYPHIKKRANNSTIFAVGTAVIYKFMLPMLPTTSVTQKNNWIFHQYCVICALICEQSARGRNGRRLQYQAVPLIPPSSSVTSSLTTKLQNQPLIYLRKWNFNSICSTKGKNNRKYYTAHNDGAKQTRRWKQLEKGIQRPLLRKRLWYICWIFCLFVHRVYGKTISKGVYILIDSNTNLHSMEFVNFWEIFVWYMLRRCLFMVMVFGPRNPHKIYKLS